MMVIKHAMGNVRFFNCVSHLRCGWVDSIEVRLKDLRKAVYSWVKQADECLRNDVLMQIVIPNSFEDKIRSGSDVFSERKTGFLLFSVPSIKEWANE